jgi:hypothetical protein
LPWSLDYGELKIVTWYREREREVKCSSHYVKFLC